MFKRLSPQAEQKLEARLGALEVCNSLPREEAFNHEILLLTTHYQGFQ